VGRAHRSHTVAPASHRRTLRPLHDHPARGVGVGRDHRRAEGAGSLGGECFARRRGPVLLFGLWWLYFLEPAGEGLASHRSRSFLWGYGHYLLFAAIAAIGAALEVAVEAGTSEAGTHGAGTPAAISPLVLGYALAIPVALFFVLLFLLHAVIAERAATRPFGFAVAAAIVLLVPLGAPSFGVPPTIVLIALVTSALTATSIVDNVRRAARGAQ
jgi:low temperature requirement protein LtrA